MIPKSWWGGGIKGRGVQGLGRGPSCSGANLGGGRSCWAWGEGPEPRGVSEATGAFLGGGSGHPHPSHGGEPPGFPSPTGTPLPPNPRGGFGGGGASWECGGGDPRRGLGLGPPRGVAEFGVTPSAPPERWAPPRCSSSSSSAPPWPPRPPRTWRSSRITRWGRGNLGGGAGVGSCSSSQNFSSR